MHGMSLFPKVLWSFNYLTLTLNKPSEFSECYLLFDHFCLTMIDELSIYALYSYENKANKSLLRQGLACSPLERVAVLYLFLHRTR